MNYIITTLLFVVMLVYCDPVQAESSFVQKYGDRLVSFLQEESEVSYPSEITLV